MRRARRRASCHFPRGRKGDIADLRASIGLRAVARALSDDEEGLKEAWSMAQKGVMLAPWDRRSWERLDILKEQPLALLVCVRFRVPSDPSAHQRSSRKVSVRGV
jgi:hypothetical protein